MSEICVNRKLSGGLTQPALPQRQNTILGHRIVARLSDQPHISGCGGQVEEWGEVGAVIDRGWGCVDRGCQIAGSRRTLAPGGFSTGHQALLSPPSPYLPLRLNTTT